MGIISSYDTILTMWKTTAQSVDELRNGQLGSFLWKAFQVNGNGRNYVLLGTDILFILLQELSHGNSPLGTD